MCAPLAAIKDAYALKCRTHHILHFDFSSLAIIVLPSTFGSPGLTYLRDELLNRTYEHLLRYLELKATIRSKL